MTNHTQREAFLHGEGDHWFERNRPALEAANPLRDRVIERIAAQLPSDSRSRVLEVGCGLGQNLDALAARRPIDAHGVDPSPAAVEAGRSRFPALALDVGTADALPYPDAAFDVVWFGFCFYLVDRTLLQRAVSEADRVLADGGLLAVLDFDPDVPTVRTYHHRPGLRSYKMDHSRLFLANPAYVLVDKLALSHMPDCAWQADPQERVALTLSRKSLAYAYKDLG